MQKNSIKLCYVCERIFLGKTPIYSDNENEYFIIGQKNNQPYGINFNGIKYAEELFFKCQQNEEFLQFGDLLLNTLGTGSVGRIGFWNINNDYTYLTDGHIMIIRCNKSAYSRYVFYCMLTRQKELEDMAVGSTNQAFLTVPKIYKIVIPFPSIPEQQRIADFLDKKCAEIDTVIEKTKSTVEEYKKLRQSIITEAVTKGIRGNRPMKDSGIEWIPIIPQDASISRVGLHYKIILGKMLCSTQLNEDYSLEFYYCAADVHFDGISKNEKKQMWFSTVEKEQYLVRESDLLVVEGGAGAGGCTIVKGICNPIYVQNSIMIVRSKTNSNPQYLKYLIESFVKQGYVDIVCNKATIPHFTKDKLSNMPYIVFKNNEQQEIVDYLDTKCTEIDNLITAKQSLLTELEAYKKSVIYEYVTGKKEV